MVYFGGTEITAPMTYQDLFNNYASMSLYSAFSGIILITLIVFQWFKINSKYPFMYFIILIIFVVAFLFSVDCLIYFYFNYIPIELGKIIDSTIIDQMNGENFEIKGKMYI